MQASTSKWTEKVKAKLLSSWESLLVIKCCSSENVILISEIIKPRVCRAASLLNHITHRTWLWDRSCLLPRGAIGLLSLLPSPTQQCRNEAANNPNFIAFCACLQQAGERKHTSPVWTQGCAVMSGLQHNETMVQVSSDCPVYLPHSTAHVGRIYTTAPTLGTGDAAFSGVQPAWKERTGPVNANNLLSYTSSGETQAN